MNNNTKVSIIIPCYNAESTIRSAIESALGQTYQNIEVVVVDDGSTDKSLEVIRSFGDSIRWESGANRGGCAARNRGIELATGELIQFLDADDLLIENKLSIQVPLIKAKVADIVVCDWKSTDGDKDTVTRLSFDGLVPDPFSYFLRHSLITLSPIHWRKNLLAIGGFRAELPCSQERDLHLRLAANGFTFFHTPHVLVHVIRREKSVSSNYLRVLIQHENIFENSYSVLKSNDLVTYSREKNLAKAFLIDAYNLHRVSEYNKSQVYLEKGAITLKRSNYFRLKIAYLPVKFGSICYKMYKNLFRSA
tara:strand:+ start:3362 stop:4282 length:921 start_codon:yes stop_codon:yes gene_type:complete